MSNTNIPLPSEGVIGGRDNDTATATCFCGTVQLLFPTKAPGLVGSFVCNCTDCRKITASMFASNFTVLASETKHVRGRDKLTKFAQSKTIESGNTMENHFCSVCGSLMYRISSGYPELLITRIGTVDDFDLHETVLKPRMEIYTKDRVCWLSDVDGAVQHKDAGPLGSSVKEASAL